MTNFRLSLTLSMVVAGLSLIGFQPAFSSDIDDMLKKYPNNAPQPANGLDLTIRGKEANLLNAMHRHIDKLYNQINSAARSGRITNDQAGNSQIRVKEIEQELLTLERNAKDKPESAPTGLSTLHVYTTQLDYSDMSRLVQAIGIEEADLGDLIAKGEKKAAELASKDKGRPAAPAPTYRPSEAKPYRPNTANNSVY